VPDAVSARLREAELMLAKGQARLAQARLDAAAKLLADAHLPDQHPVHQQIGDLRRAVAARLPKPRPERPPVDGPGIVTPAMRASSTAFPRSRSIRTVSGGLPTLGRDR
jgi:hypothetical protein